MIPIICGTGYDVVLGLNKYVFPCTFTGMKYLVDQSASNSTEGVQQGKLNPYTLAQSVTGRTDDQPVGEPVSPPPSQVDAIDQPPTE